MIFDQAEYEVRCEWGLRGLSALGPVSDVVVIVDVLSFSTAVDVAVAKGASVLPYLYKDDSAEDFARTKGALLASNRSGGGYGLSPASLQSIPPGTALVLPSPNGSTLSLASNARTTFTACLRNCEAVTEKVAACGRTVAVIPVGEQWSDGSLRPCVEDLAGAGALLSALRGRRSPEAEVAVAVFERFRHGLAGMLANSISGRELIERGFACDIAIAAEYGSSRAVPMLMRDRFVNVACVQA